MNFNWMKEIMPWRLRLWIHLFFVKHPEFYFSNVQQRKSSVEYNLDVFQSHMNKMNVSDLSGAVICELGPGDSMSHTLQAFALGCKQMWLLDIADLAGQNLIITQKDVDTYVRYISCDSDRRFPHVENETWGHYLKKINGIYLTNGLKSYYEIPNESVDYIFSQAVLEHIRLDIFEETIREIYRFVKKGGLFHRWLILEIT